MSDAMGGFQAIHAAAREPSVRAVVAICRAPEESLRSALRSGGPLRLVAPPGGYRRSLQNDPEMQALSIRWIARFGSREVP